MSEAEQSDKQCCNCRYSIRPRTAVRLSVTVAALLLLLGLAWVLIGARQLAARRIDAAGGILSASGATADAFYDSWCFRTLGQESFDRWILPLLPIDKIVIVRHEVHAPISDATVASLLQFRGVRYLTLERKDLSVAGARMIAKLPELRDLSLKNTNLTDEDLAAFGRLQHLECLDIRGTNARGEGFSRWPDSSPLMDLALGDGISVECFADLARFKSLVSLGIPTPDSIEFLGELEHLESVQIESALNEDEERLLDLARRIKAVCPRLKYLNGREIQQENEELRWK